MVEQVFDHGEVGLGELRQLAGKVAPVALAGELLLPVRGELAGLVPGNGLRRGSVVGVSGSGVGAGATSLLWSMVAAASAEGSWVALVGLADVGWVAAADAGVHLDRVATVPHPGGQWPMVTAALLDAIDIVVVRPPARTRHADAHRLAARARERSNVLVVMGDAWPEAPDVRLYARASNWVGLGAGHGVLEERALDVVVDGRRGASRERRAVVCA
jgi:hypothetical protein